MGDDWEDFVVEVDDTQFWWCTTPDVHVVRSADGSVAFEEAQWPGGIIYRELTE